MSWKPETYKASKIDEMIKKELIVTPKYQRGAKWNDEQRASLIDSIKRGFPFGSILLNKRILPNGYVQYDLIDGLQRCNTINTFLNRPGDYFKGDDIEESSLKAIYDLISPEERNKDQNAGADEISDAIVDYVKRNLQTMEQVKCVQYYNVSTYLKNKWPSLGGSIDKLNGIIQNLFEPFRKTCTSLTDAEIPAIIYDGDPNLLPEVFERINSKGTTLSKYDIYSASWTGSDFMVVDSDFNSLYDYICKRYEEMNDSDIRVADFDSIEYKQKQTISAFDLCFAFGKMLKNEYPLLFGVNGDAISVDGIGFNLINACLGKKAADLSKLGQAMQAYAPNITSLLRCILKACECAFNYLKVIITLKGNSKKEARPMLHSENQIISIVASIFLARFCKPEKDKDDKIVDIHFTSDDNEEWAHKKTIFKKNIPIAYVSDSLSNVWSGTGDKRLYSIINDSACFLREYTREDFESAFDGWFNAVRQRAEREKVMNANSTDKIILNIYTSQTVTASDAHNSETWDIEHICPKKVLKDAIAKYNSIAKSDEEKLALPISSIGNVCYLPTTLNRTKEEKTIYQAGLSQSELAEVESKYTLTSEDDLAWLSDESLSAAEFRERYMSFIKKRADLVKKLVADSLFC